MKKIRLFEMFAGFGGASFALEKAKIPFECVGYSEIDRNAIEVYNTNHPDIKNYGDCKNIVPEKLPNFDLLTAGFPCQPFSVNTNHKIRGKVHKESNLFKDIIRILSVKKPKYILLENVKGIKGEKSREIFEELENGLKDIGYGLKIVDVNSKDYGTPQNRERVLFLGVLNEKEGNVIKVPEKEELKRTVKDLLEIDTKRREPRVKQLKLSKEINLDKYGDISRFDAILMNPVKKKNSNVAFEILDAPSNVVSRQSDRIYHPTFAPCLTATGKDYMFYTGGKVIVLTPKECFRLMGFFNDEIKFGNLNESKLYKLAGNGWDINLISKFLKRLIKVEERTSQIKMEKYFCPVCKVISLHEFNKDKRICPVCNNSFD